MAIPCKFQVRICHCGEIMEKTHFSKIKLGPQISSGFINAILVYSDAATWNFSKDVF